MSKITNNPLVQGASGHFNRQFVYKQRGNKTYIAKMPAKKENLEPTPEQNEIRDQFGSAALYAKGVMSDPLLKKEYQKKAKNGATAFNVAFRDYLKAPVVKGIDTSKYTGVPGSLIIVSAKDDFRVASVRVKIETAAGVLIEEGDSTLNPIDRNKWNYATTQANASIAGCVVKADAFDLPGNKGSLDVMV
jgi:hypothetical protein